MCVTLLSDRLEEMVRGLCAGSTAFTDDTTRDYSTVFFN